MSQIAIAMKPIRWGRSAAAAVLLAAAAFAAASPALADKLVVFKNGKTFRVKNVKDEKGWTRLELDATNYMGVRSNLILAVEEVTGTAPAKVDLPNQVPLGGGGGGYSPPPQSYSPRSEEQPEAQPEQGDDFQQAPQEGVVPPPPPSPVPTINGARPFNQQPQQQFGGRGLRRGNSTVNAPSNLRQPLRNVNGPGVNRPIRGADRDGDD